MTTERLKVTIAQAIAILAERDTWDLEVVEIAEALLLLARDAESVIQQAIKDHTAEARRLRVWLQQIGALADVDADERGWMVRDALDGKEPS